MIQDNVVKYLIMPHKVSLTALAFNMEWFTQGRIFTEYEKWCRQTVGPDNIDWCRTIGPDKVDWCRTRTRLGNTVTMTFHFKREEDATMFALKFL